MVRFIEERPAGRTATPNAENGVAHSSADRLAPVIPLFPQDVLPREEGPPELRPHVPRDHAEKTLLKKLRSRQLSVAEAHVAVVACGASAGEADAIVAEFLDRGYLDDARLAEQIVDSAVRRKGLGRRAIAQSLAKRAIPRDVAVVALEELPDDDADRALDLARSKARTMGGADRQQALRRLAGQLARRGYSGQEAMSAARQALDEADASERS